MAVPERVLKIQKRSVGPMARSAEKGFAPNPDPRHGGSMARPGPDQADFEGIITSHSNKGTCAILREPFQSSDITHKGEK